MEWADAEEQRNQESRNQEESDTIELDESKGTCSSLLEFENQLCTVLGTCWSCFWDFSQAVEMSNFLPNVGLWALLRRNSSYDPGKKVEILLISNKSKGGGGLCDRLCCWLLWSWEAARPVLIPQCHRHTSAVQAEPGAWARPNRYAYKYICSVTASFWCSARPMQKLSFF